jgi:sugar O-acyltransferase (sialic acid O-acetyltransferase NeuD family)
MPPAGTTDEVDPVTATPSGSRPYVIVGAGGMAREALAWARDAWPHRAPLGFVAAPGTPEGTELLSLPVVGAFEDFGRALSDLAVVLGLGDPALRRRVAAEAGAGGAMLSTLVHPTAHVGVGSSVGEGAIVGPTVTITRDAHLGEGVIINYGASIGHDATIGAYAFVGPAAALGGDVALGEEVFVGLNATILPGITVARGATVGAGAVVTRDVAPGETVVGNPARPRRGVER